MAKIKYDDGTVINFEGDPSPKDIEEAYANVKGTKKGVGENIRDLSLDLATKIPGVGGVATAGLGNVFKALQNPIIRSGAQKTALPVTAALTGQLPAYATYMAAEKYLPRPDQAQAISRIPKNVNIPETLQAGIVAARPELAGAVQAIQSPQETIRTGLQVGREGIKIALAGGVQGVYNKLTGGYVSINPKKVKVTHEEIATLKNKGINIRDKATLNKLRVEKAKTQTIQTLKKNNALLEKQLQDDMVTEVPKMKESVGSYFKAFNTSYGNSLDDVTTSLNKKISPKEAEAWINNLINRLKLNPEYAETNAFKKIDSLKKVFSGKKISTGLLDAKGKPLSRITKDGSFNVKNFYSEIKNTLKGRVYDGKSNVDNLVYDELRHSWGDFVATKDSSFAQLQQEASKVLQLKKFASKVFKPYSEYDTKKLETLIMNNAKGKASVGEKNILKETYKIMNDAGIDTRSLDNLAKEVVSGKSRLSAVDAKTKLLINKIKQDQIRQLSPIKQKEIMQSAIMKGQKDTSKIKAVGKGIGKVLDVVWRVMLFKAIGR